MSRRSASPDIQAMDRCKRTKHCVYVPGMTFSRALKLDRDGQFCSSVDDEAGVYGVFGSVSDFCYGTYTSKVDAAKAAHQMNERNRLLRERGSPRRRHSPSPSYQSSLRENRDELHKMTRLLLKCGAKSPAATAWELQQKGVSLPELEFRLQAGERLSSPKKLSFGFGSQKEHEENMRLSKVRSLVFNIVTSLSGHTVISPGLIAEWEKTVLRKAIPRPTKSQVALFRKALVDHRKAWLRHQARLRRTPGGSPQRDALGHLAHRAARRVARLFKR